MNKKNLKRIGIITIMLVVIAGICWGIKLYIREKDPRWQAAKEIYRVQTALQEVDENTKNILIESAIFDSISVRLTSKKILRSEASNRFEKGLDPKRTYMAIERSCNLLNNYANGEVTNNLIEYNTLEIVDKVIHNF